MKTLLHIKQNIFNYLHNNFEYESISSYLSDTIKVGIGAFTGAQIFQHFVGEVFHIITSLMIAIGVSFITFFGPLLYRHLLNSYKGKNKHINGMKEQLNHKK